jgi:chromosome segregation protein
MVDEILNDKDNSRRHLFEEAAGISKFRVRKRETMRKLEATDLDLERVEDLIYEIQKNMRSLERQARQTSRYFKIKDEYKELSIQLAKKTVAIQREQLESINKQIAKENNKKTILSKQIGEKEASIESAKKDLIEKEKNLATKQKDLNEFVAQIRQFESDKKIKNEKLRFLRDKSSSLKDQIEQDKKSNERASFSIQSLKQEKKSAEITLREIENKLKMLTDEHLDEKKRTQVLQDEVDSMNGVYKIKHDEVFQFTKTFEIKEIQLNTLKQELEKTTTDTTEQSESLVEFDKKIKEIKSDLNSKTKYLNSLKTGEKQLVDRIESSEKMIEKIKDELSSTNRILDSKQNEYNLTKSLVDNLEGFPEAIRFLRKQKGWGKSAPLLTDIVATEEKYRATIENYLEPYMNYYVVDTEADAFKAVNLLSEASKGRAHFFILDSFEKFTPAPIKIFDNATPATEIVEYDSKYNKLISYILNNVYLISNTSNEFPQDEEAIFITANGKFTKKRFSISGGSVGLFEGKRIGRAKNLEKLDREIKRLNKKLLDIKNKLNEENKAIIKLKGSTKKEQIEILKNEINQLNESLISLKTREEQYTKLLSNESTKKENIQEQITSLNKDLNELVPITEKGKTDLEILGEKITGLQNELKNQQELLSLKSTAYNDENILFHQQTNKIGSIDQEINFKSIAFESSKERINKNQETLELNEKEIKDLLLSEEISEDLLISMYDKKEVFEKALNDSEKDYYSARGNIDELDTQIREFQHNRENIDVIIIELKDKLNEIKLQLNSIKERLSVEFQVKLDDILSMPPSDEEQEISEEELKEKVETIKTKLDKIGPINPMAMEAYEEVKKRNDFITEQREDLLKAKESLVATIDEIDLAARANFMEAFENIKENFINVFRTLFGEEDDCDLLLTNPEDPLSSSIEIIAKPKGKKPLTINQLSGGEKTLTATSLLFAIYLMKPAPFCIFDEVDAPLDDANLDKFNMIIRKFSKDSQFIIVTHNKRTMISTDIIYGITMVEQGISKVVPVDLRELEV